LKNEITYDEGEFSLVYKDNNLFIDFFNKSYINYTLNNVIYDLTKNYEMFSILYESGNIFSLLGVVLEHDYMLKQRIQYKQIMDKPFDPKKPYLYNDFMTFLTTEKAWIYEDELYLLDKDNNKKLYIENLNNIKEAL
jgi:hypothetical protein